MALQTCSNVTPEDVAVFGECCPYGCDSSLNLNVLCCIFVPGRCSVQRSRTECCYIYWCVGFRQQLCLRLIHIQTLIFTFMSIWYISAHEYVVGEAKMTTIFAVYLQASGFPSQPSGYAFECCRKQFGQYAVLLS